MQGSDIFPISSEFTLGCRVWGSEASVKQRLSQGHPRLAQARSNRKAEVSVHLSHPQVLVSASTRRGKRNLCPCGQRRGSRTGAARTSRTDPAWCRQLVWTPLCLSEPVAHPVSRGAPDSRAVCWGCPPGLCSSRHTAALSFLQDLSSCQKLCCATVACPKTPGGVTAQPSRAIIICWVHTAQQFCPPSLSTQSSSRALQTEHNSSELLELFVGKDH